MAGKSDNADVDRNVITPSSVQTQTPFQQFLRTMEMEATADAETATFTGDDLTQLLTAESEEELWEADERPPLNAQHLGGCEVELLDVTVKYSRGGADIDSGFITADGKKMYLMVTAVRLSDPETATAVLLPKIGEVFQFNTSARYLTTKLFQFYLRGYINPDTGRKLRCYIRSTPLEGGQAVLKLRPPRTNRAVNE